MTLQYYIIIFDSILRDLSPPKQPRNFEYSRSSQLNAFENISREIAIATSKNIIIRSNSLAGHAAIIYFIYFI